MYLVNVTVAAVASQGSYFTSHACDSSSGRDGTHKK